jgi:hypothetical protein
MPSMNVFRNSAFSMTSLTGQVEKIDYLPQLLGSLGLFEPMPVSTREIWVDRRDGALTLIPTSALGAPPEELARDPRDMVPLRTTRLAKGFTLYAYEVDGLRPFGSENELMTVQAEYLRRMSRVSNDMELTHEFHRLGALQGKLLDADGSSVIYDYFSEFDVAEPAEVDFELDDDTTNVRLKSANLRRSMVQGSKGAIPQSAAIHALAGDEFYDKLITHPTVERTYQNWAAAADLREDRTYESFTFGGITYHNYRGTDDNSTVAVPTAKAKFFPVGAPEVFKQAMAPAEFGPYVNTRGRRVYAMNLIDPSGRQAFTRGEQYSYPLYFCQRPDVLRSAKMQ